MWKEEEHDEWTGHHLTRHWLQPIFLRIKFASRAALYVFYLTGWIRDIRDVIQQLLFRTGAKGFTKFF